MDPAVLARDGADPAELLDFLNAGRGALNDAMDVELTEATPERVVGSMPVAGNTQPYGLLHGGASCVLAETLASVGSSLHAGAGRLAVGIEINASHHGSAKSGTVTGVATAIRLGRTLASYEVVLTDETGRRLCTARVTCALRDR
jgi:1,4-dihydroxy-2-naphthoyl-CoA hydrolase